MKDWQYTVLFFVGVGGAVLLLLAPAIGLGSVLKNPLAAGGVTTILAYVLTQRNREEGKKESTDSAPTPTTTKDPEKP